MELQSLQSLESLCETLYKAQDAAQRAQTEQVRPRSPRCCLHTGATPPSVCQPRRPLRRVTHLWPWRALFARHQLLRPFGTSTEYIPQCRAILDASSNPYAQHFAASSLLKLLTEHSTLSPQARPARTSSIR